MVTKRLLVYVYLVLTAGLTFGLMACGSGGGGGGESGPAVGNEIEIEFPTLEETFSTDCNEIWVSGETTYLATHSSVVIKWENRTDNGYLQGTGQRFVNTCTGWFMGYTWDYDCDASWGASIPLEVGDNVITITAVDSIIEAVIGQDTITVNKPVISYSIKGEIKNIDGMGLFDMPVNLDAQESYTTYTDPNGNYEFKCLRNGTYSVVADSYGFYSPIYRFHSYMDWPFIPDGRLVTVTNSDVTGQDFSTEVYVVSGTIKTQAGYGFQMVDVLIIGADGTSASTWTDENGGYYFLVPNGTYTIRPSPNFSFTPVEQSIEVNGSGVYTQDFSAN